MGTNRIFFDDYLSIKLINKPIDIIIPYRYMSPDVLFGKKIFTEK